MSSAFAQSRSTKRLTDPNSPIVSLRQLRVTFQTSRGPVSALRGVDLDIPRGQFFGIVGESGCGKSVTGRALMGLLPKNASVTGEIVFDGISLAHMPKRDLLAIRGRRIAMIFQDPGRALNPVFTVGQQLLSVLRRHRGGSKSDSRRAAIQLLRRVGLSQGEQILQTYPFQLSGGMQQRAMIAIALAGQPDLLIADEPTTALDVTIQAQILDLLAELQASRGMTVVLITHDIGVIARSCREVAVFYAGRVVEHGSVRSVLRSARHPYSQGLLASLPARVAHGKPVQTIPGSVPNALVPIQGCAFAPRCPFVHGRCGAQPPAVEVDGTTTECWLYVSGDDPA